MPTKKKHELEIKYNLDAEILTKDFLELKSFEKVAKKYNTTTRIIRNLYYKFNLKLTNQHKPRIKFPSIEEIQKSYNKLGSIGKVSKFFNIENESMRRFMINNNIDYEVKFTYTIDHDFFSKDNEFSYYWAGFFAADACITDGDVISLLLSKKDEKHLMTFNTHINGDLKIRFHRDFKLNRSDNSCFKQEYYDSARSVFTSHQMAKDLKKFGIGPRKSMSYEIPPLNEELFHHFIRGMIDGDGWITRNKKYNSAVIGCCGTQQSMECISEFLKRKLSLDETSGCVTKKVNIFNFAFSGSNCLKICEFLYQNSSVALDRKKEIVMNFIMSRKNLS